MSPFTIVIAIISIIVISSVIQSENFLKKRLLLQNHKITPDYNSKRQVKLSLPPSRNQAHPKLQDIQDVSQLDAVRLPGIILLNRGLNSTATIITSDSMSEDLLNYPPILPKSAVVVKFLRFSIRARTTLLFLLVNSSILRISLTTGRACTSWILSAVFVNTSKDPESAQA